MFAMGVANGGAGGEHSRSCLRSAKFQRPVKLPAIVRHGRKPVGYPGIADHDLVRFGSCPSAEVVSGPDDLLLANGKHSLMDYEVVPVASGTKNLSFCPWAMLGAKYLVAQAELAGERERNGCTDLPVL